MSDKWYDTIEFTHGKVDLTEPVENVEAMMGILNASAHLHEPNQTVVFRIRERTRKRLGWDKTWAVDTPLGPGVVLVR